MENDTNYIKLQLNIIIIELSFIAGILTGLLLFN